MLNEEDLAVHGFRDGERADLISAHGRMANALLLAYPIARGSVMAYFPEANVLTGVAVDPRSKTPSFKATPVRLVRASAAE
jgi:anaerobic selenocysteine-containing dehydrogenase